MALNSRAKGKAAELEICHVLRELFGWVARRSQQFSGWAKGGDSPDIICDQTPSLFWEVKRVERLNLPRAMGLAIKQAGRKTPVVVHRTNRSAAGWLLTIRLTDLPMLCHAYETAQTASLASPALPNADTDHGEDRSLAAGTARRVPTR